MLSLIAQLAKQAALSSDKINPQDSFDDIVYNLSPRAVKRRAGRSRVMAEAADVPIPYRINRPALSLFTDMSLGSGLGGLAGKLLGDEREATQLGAALGTGLGGLFNTVRRISQMKDINDAYDVKNEFGKLRKIQKPERSSLNKLYNFNDLSGRHGEQQAYEAIVEGKKPTVSTGKALADYVLGHPAIEPVYNAAGTLNEVATDRRNAKINKLRSEVSKQANSVYLGAGLGALTGGLKSLMQEPEYTEDGKPVSKSRSVLQNALIGGGLGGLAGYGYSQLPATAPETKPTPPPAPVSSMTPMQSKMQFTRLNTHPAVNLALSDLTNALPELKQLWPTEYLTESNKFNPSMTARKTMDNFSNMNNFLTKTYDAR